VEHNFLKKLQEVRDQYVPFFDADPLVTIIIAPLSLSKKGDQYPPF
jgi:hypothetical protein